jgi:hypothetical protein
MHVEAWLKSSSVALTQTIGSSHKPLEVPSPSLRTRHLKRTFFVTAAQSGGPVLDKWGRVVGITSMNNDWQNPRFHRAALVSVGVDLLNRYLTQFGLPQLALAASPTSSTDAGATTVSGSAAQPSVPKLVLSGRTGQVTVQIRGTGGGELSHSRTAEQKLGEQRDARIEAVGAEKSQCDESSGRTRSEARAAGSIQTFELTGLKMRFDLWAQGGHYRTAATCIAGKPVGLSGNDTAATAVAEGNGEITSGRCRAV